MPLTVNTVATKEVCRIKIETHGLSQGFNITNLLIQIIILIHTLNYRSICHGAIIPSPTGVSRPILKG